MRRPGAHPDIRRNPSTPRATLAAMNTRSERRQQAAEYEAQLDAAPPSAGQLADVIYLLKSLRAMMTFFVVLAIVGIILGIIGVAHAVSG